MKGFVQKECAFAGHSFGEYSALASIADVLPISSLIDIVFYRGITMQQAVERDAENRSNYAMCAVNPSRISKTFSDAALREVVDSIALHTGALLEIVNYNVEVRTRCRLLVSEMTASSPSTGSAICVRRRTRGSSNYDKCLELPQSAEDRHCEGALVVLWRLYLYLLTLD